jgi:hypothetical protein
MRLLFFIFSHYVGNAVVSGLLFHTVFVAVLRLSFIAFYLLVEIHSSDASSVVSN